MDRCPSDHRLLQPHSDSDSVKRAGRKFAESLKSIKRKNSHVLIDCPPALTTLSLMALQGADYYLVPTLATPMSTEALRAFLGYLENEKKAIASNARLLGILITMVNPYLRLSIDSIKELRSTFK